ncbi:MAG: hypothetical protein WC057_06410 [Dehalococcoidales bacterium]
MKSKPKKTTPPKTHYVVKIDDKLFTTFATNEDSAISNAAYQYAVSMEKDVRLVRWEIKEGIIRGEVVEDK